MEPLLSIYSKQQIATDQFENVASAVVAKHLPKDITEYEGKYYYEIDLTKLPKNIKFLVVEATLDESQFVKCPAKSRLDLNKLNITERSQLKQQFFETQQGKCCICYDPLNERPLSWILEFPVKQKVLEKYGKNEHHLVYTQSSCGNHKWLIGVAHSYCNLVRHQKIQSRSENQNNFYQKMRRLKAFRRFHNEPSTLLSGIKWGIRKRIKEYENSSPEFL